MNMEIPGRDPPAGWLAGLMYMSIGNNAHVLRALHNSYFLKEDGLFFSSKAPGLVFSATYLRGSFAPSALPR